MTTNISTITMLQSLSDPRVRAEDTEPPPCARGAVYLSGPMTLLHRKSRQALLDYAWKMSWFEQRLVERDFVVFNPYASVLHPHNFDPKFHAGWITHDEYLMKAATLLVKAGLVERAIWMGCPGWHESDGSKQEMGLARELGMELVEWRWRFMANKLSWRNVAFIGVK